MKRCPTAIIQEEKISGKKKYRDRPVLDNLLNLMQSGDKLVVYKLDRLARSLNDLLQLTQLFDEKGIALEILDQSIDTSCASGKAFLQMLGVFAEFETNLRGERQAQGIEKAKQNNTYKGRSPSIDYEKVIDLYDANLTIDSIALEMRVCKSSIYRILNKFDVKRRAA
jgi:DNA invertase Pin-like site-specific DNA recombinase